MSLNCDRRGGYGDSTEETTGVFTTAPIRNPWQIGPLPVTSHHAGNACNIGASEGAGQGAILFQGFLGGRSGGGLYGGSQPTATGHARWDLNPVQVGENQTSNQRVGHEQAKLTPGTRLRGPDDEDLLGYSADQRLGQQNNLKGSCVIYKECQKNQALDSANHCVDGCGEFMRKGRDGQEALHCMACGCHRSYHRSVRVGDNGEEENVAEESRSNIHVSLGRIENVALNLMEATGRALPLLAMRQRGGDELPHKELNTLIKVSVENLDHIAKVTLSTVECIGILQSASSTQQSASSRDRHLKHLDAGSPPFPCNPDQGRLSSEVSPVSTTEKRRYQKQLSPTPQFIPSNPQAGISAPLLNAQAGSRPQRDQNASPVKPKRKRTQFTDEQRGKMKAYAEHAGWTIVGQRKENIAAACKDIGVAPKTLKYWIHNAKQKLKRMNEQPV